MNNHENIRIRISNFYSQTATELELIKDLVLIKLKQLALAYTSKNNLPREAVTIIARVKSLKSFLKKLERNNWPSFSNPTDVVKDLIGARVVCWFLDDCHEFLEAIRASTHFVVQDIGGLEYKDYIKNPQNAGYRGLHVFAKIKYDNVEKVNNKILITPEELLCEIQIRSKLQDAWAEITHEFFYKAKDLGAHDNVYESLLADISARLATEDQTFLKFRDVYQKLAEEKSKKDKLTESQKVRLFPQKILVDPNNKSIRLEIIMKTKLVCTYLIQVKDPNNSILFGWEGNNLNAKSSTYDIGSGIKNIDRTVWIFLTVVDSNGKGGNYDIKITLKQNGNVLSADSLTLGNQFLSPNERSSIILVAKMIDKNENKFLK